MLSRLPPRVHMFVRQMLYYTVGLFAFTGAFAVYRGDAKAPEWWLFVAFAVGSALGALVHDVPRDILDARARRLDSKT